jgi:protein TonB
MERPSHITFDTHHFSRRLPMIGLALTLQLGGVWLFVHGLRSGVIHFDSGPIEFVQVHDPDKPRVEPPEPNIPTKIKTEKPVTPIFTPARPKPGPFTRMPPTTNDPPPVRGIDRALLSITGTHTVPPYPPIARRLGAEGKVTLSLTVSGEGKVIAAEIVTSSGRDDMDQSAQQWIMAHWAYKPALDNGVPKVSQTLATVVFSLVNAR